MASDHTAQLGNIAFGTVDMDAIEEAVCIRVIDPLEVDSIRRLVAMRCLAGNDHAAGTKELHRGGRTKRLRSTAGTGFDPTHDRREDEVQVTRDPVFCIHLRNIVLYSGGVGMAALGCRHA